MFWGFVLINNASVFLFSGVQCLKRKYGNERFISVCSRFCM
nr:MAG TPA: hypothetical protein [Caudoviricetes sp.]